MGGVIGAGIRWGEARAAVADGRWWDAARVAFGPRGRRWLLGQLRTAEPQVWAWCVEAARELPHSDPAALGAAALALGVLALEQHRTLAVHITWIAAPQQVDQVRAYTDYTCPSGYYADVSYYSPDAALSWVWLEVELTSLLDRDDLFRAPIDLLLYSDRYEDDDVPY